MIVTPLNHETALLYERLTIGKSESLNAGDGRIGDRKFGPGVA
jgi:hypothetical protein